MFIFGIFGVIQAFILPGLILLKRINFKSRLIPHAIATISTSLIINYCLVFLLTILRIYTRSIMLVLFSGEVIVTAWLYWADLNKPVELWLQKIRKKLIEFADGWKKYLHEENIKSGFQLILRLTYLAVSIALAYMALNWIVRLFTWNLGSVFNSYDTIVSWNKWAVAWANNSLPVSTWRYPQLLPTTWSIFYVFMGDTSIQMFGQGIMPLFTFFILIMMIDLSISKRNAGFLIAAAIAYLTLKKFLGSYLIEGFADMPVAFFAFSAVYLLMELSSAVRKIPDRKRYETLIAVTAAGTAITKQIGLLFLLLFSLVYFMFIIWPILKQGWHKYWKYLLMILLLVLCIVLPWYLYKQVMIWQGMEKSEVELIVGHTERYYESAGIFGRLSEVAGLMEKYFYLLVLIIPISFFLEPIIRAIVYLIMLPLIISWGYFASYDFRNLAIFFPLFAVSGGLSIDLLITKFLKLMPIQFTKKMTVKWVILVISVTLILTSLVLVPDQKLRLHQNEQALNTFSPTLNRKILEIVEQHPQDYTIITSYPLMNIPGLTGRKISFLFDNYNDYQLTLSRLEANHAYLLIPKYAEKNIMADVDNKLESGQFNLIFEDDSWIPYLFIEMRK